LSKSIFVTKIVFPFWFTPPHLIIACALSPGVQASSKKYMWFAALKEIEVPAAVMFPMKTLQRLSGFWNREIISDALHVVPPKSTAG
jgi:hypothetical protein